MTTLVLGGTQEARALAARLVAEGFPVVSSLAGRVRRPRLPEGEVRIGGFGGVDGLCAYLAKREVDAVIDATHPFAARISQNASSACARTGIRLLRVERPGWDSEPDAAAWHWAESDVEAATLAARLGRRVVLTTGRQSIATYRSPLRHHQVLARAVDPVEIDLPDSWRVLLARGPHTYAAERALLDEHRAEVLVTKDSGGARAKLDAARDLDLAVVVVRRPGLSESAWTVSDVEAAVRWLRTPARDPDRRRST